MADIGTYRRRNDDRERGSDARLYTNAFRHVENAEHFIEHRDDDRPAADAEKTGEDADEDSGAGDPECKPDNLAGGGPNGCLKLGTAIGAGAGLAAAGACDLGTAGACAIGNPGIVAAGTGFGMGMGSLGDTLGDSLDRLVHGNSLQSMQQTYVYELRQEVTGELLKYGITSNPGERYTNSFYISTNSSMNIIQTYNSRLPARMHEFGLCLGYVAANGKLPPLSVRC